MGHNLSQAQTDDELVAMGIGDELEDWANFTLDDEQVDKLLDVDIEDAYEDASSIFGDDLLSQIDEVRYAVIISMAFQLGGGGLRKFKGFIAAVKDGDYDRAADEMLYANVAAKTQSAWYKQTPERCQGQAGMMRYGNWGGARDTQWEGDHTDNDIPPPNLDIAELLSTFSTKELLDEVSRRLEEQSLTEG